MKKRLLSIMLAVVMLISGISIYASAENKTYSLGDVNGDGNITASDARTVLRVAAHLEAETENIQLYGDINKDKKITASDARTILRIAANLENIEGREFNDLSQLTGECSHCGKLRGIGENMCEGNCHINFDDIPADSIPVPDYPDFITSK